MFPKAPAGRYILNLLFILIVSCASPPPPQRQTYPLTPSIREIESLTKIKAMNERILMSALSKDNPYHEYRIGPEDLLEIFVFEDEKLNRVVRVNAQGDINFPLLGIVRIKGLTSSEVEREIRSLLTERYFQNPHVNVFVKEYRNQQISVMGAVEKPGVFDLTGEKTVLDALALAGGLKEDAGQLLFLIQPPRGKEVAPDDRAPKTFVIDLEMLLVKGDLTLNLPLIHGDVINVPVSGKIFVGGEVRNPGGFPLKGKRVTVSQAITMAGELKPEANGSEVKIFRYAGEGAEREILTVDARAIQKGRSEDIYLRENDIVIVPQSGVKVFLIGFRDTIKGLFGFGFSLGSL